MGARGGVTHLHSRCTAHYLFLQPPTPLQWRQLLAQGRELRPTAHPHGGQGDREPPAHPTPLCISLSCRNVALLGCPEAAPGLHLTGQIHEDEELGLPWSSALWPQGLA